MDWTAKFDYDLAETLTLRLEGARKTRSPSYIERFAWLPIEATAGLGDGNIHIGQVALDPEVAHEVGVGADWTMSTACFRPASFIGIWTTSSPERPSMTRRTPWTPTWNASAGPTAIPHR